MKVDKAIKMLEAKLKCLEHMTSRTSLCNDIKCNSCSLQYEQGNIKEQKEYLQMAIFALKKIGGDENG